MIIKLTAFAIVLWLNISPAIVCTGVRIWWHKRRTEYVKAQLALTTAKVSCVETRLAHLQ